MKALDLAIRIAIAIALAFIAWALVNIEEHLRGRLDVRVSGSVITE
jgi:hypothetical protein